MRATKHKSYDRLYWRRLLAGPAVVLLFTLSGCGFTDCESELERQDQCYLSAIALFVSCDAHLGSTTEYVSCRSNAFVTLLYCSTLLPDECDGYRSD